MRRAVASLVALAAVAGAAPAQAADDPRARRAALLAEAADLTDRLEAAQVAVVAAQHRQSRAAGALARVRGRLRTRAVRAYVQGPGAALTAAQAPPAYLEVAAAKERQLMAGLRTASAEALAEQERSEEARQELRRATAELARVQAQLEAAIAADDLRRAEDERRADDARRAVLAAVQAAPAHGAPLPGRAAAYAPSPLDPDALVPRHRLATQRQAELMRRIPFGPLRPGAPLPSGLRPTGARVEGLASWYGPGFNGRPTASGAIYDQESWTVASKDLPLGTFLVVSRGDRRVLLLVNDRGPYVEGRVLDLSAAAARALGVSGVAAVVGEVVAEG